MPTSIQLLLSAAIIFFAVLTQSLTGFGSGLVAMALLVPWTGVTTAAPLVALVSGTTEAILLARYRQALNVGAVWRLSVSSFVAIPIGVYALRRAPEQILLGLLGTLMVGYALYALISPTLPELKRRGWAYGVGFLAGLLGGAYNVSGPPVIMYGQARRWPPAEFKGNLQGFFVLNSLFVVMSHAAGGNLTPLIWRAYLVGLPAIALGVAAGLGLDRILSPAAFRKMVLWLLVLLGLRLLF